MQYPNGNVSEIYSMRDCKMNGFRYVFFENGKVKYHQYYSNGFLNKESYEYYEGGNLKLNQNWRNGDLHGFSIEFYESGDTMAYGYYHSDSKYEKWVYFDSLGLKSIDLNEPISDTSSAPMEIGKKPFEDRGIDPDEFLNSLN